LVANGHRVLMECQSRRRRYSDRDCEGSWERRFVKAKGSFECDILVKSAPVCEDELDLWDVITSP